MSIQSSNSYRPAQVKEYLDQVLMLSEKDGLPKIIQKTVAQVINVVQSTVSRFLNTPTKNKLFNNFIQKFPNEISNWPKDSDSIERTLKKTDVCFFLSIKTTQEKILKNQQLNYSSLQNIQCSVQKKPDAQTTLVSGSRLIPRAYSQPPIHPSNCSKSQSTTNQLNKIKTKFDFSSKAPIVISYRGHGNDKDGQGMLFDHRSFQTSTKYPTVVSLPVEEKEKVISIFRSALKQIPSILSYGDEINEGRKMPPVINKSYEGGLLIIPGRVRKTENEQVRLKHEYRVIREALRRGQPILGICAGAWRVWEQAIIFNDNPESLNDEPETLLKWHAQNKSLMDVQDHCYNGGMIRLDNNGNYAVYNIQIHNVVVEKNSLLQTALGSKTNDSNFSVNSVHWKSVNHEKSPSNLCLSAMAKENPDISIKNRQGEKMSPQERTPEAYESVLGSPIVGIQWHPEGYNIQFHPETKKSKKADPNCHLHVNLLKYMAQAGDAYSAKRRMLKELSRKTIA